MAGRKKFYCYGCPNEDDCDYENCEYPERRDEIGFFREVFF